MYCIRSLSSSLFLRLLVTKVEHDHLGLPVRMGRLGFTDPVVTSSSEYKASIKVTNPLVNCWARAPASRCLRNSNTATEKQKQKDDCLRERLEQAKNSLPTKAKRAVELATEKESSNWLTVIPLKELDYNLNKKDLEMQPSYGATEKYGTRPWSEHAMFNLAWITQCCVSAAGSLSSAMTNCANRKQRR